MVDCGDLLRNSLPQFDFCFVREEHFDELVEVVTDVWYEGNLIIRKLEISREELWNYFNEYIKYLLNTGKDENIIAVEKKNSRYELLVASRVNLFRRIAGFVLGCDYTKRKFTPSEKCQTPKITVWMKFASFVSEKIESRYTFNAGTIDLESDLSSDSTFLSKELV